MAKIILIFISLGLFIYLFIGVISHVDIAPTKNNGLNNENKMKIDNMQNIDSVKFEAKRVLDLLREERRTESIVAIRMFWVLLALLIIQVCLWNAKRKRIR